MNDTTGEDGTMTFWEHLEELRSRVVKMVLAFLAGSILAWTQKEPLLRWVARPFVEAWNAGHLEGKAMLHFPAPASLFVAYIKLALLGGLVVSLPILLYQIWAFVAPGLYVKEKRYGLSFVVSSCALALGGAYFGWRIAFPMAFQYFLSFVKPVGSEGFEVSPTVMIEDYMDLVLQMFMVFGAVFELPVLVFFLSVIGVVNYRHLIRFARYFVVVAFVIAAVITPPDPMSQFLVAIPLCLLYGVSIGIAWLFGKKPPPDPTPTSPG
jgi:sec-independent protein translocase protein TatC